MITRPVGETILVLDEIGEESLGTKSEAHEHVLGRVLADRHPRPELASPRARAFKKICSARALPIPRPRYLAETLMQISPTWASTPGRWF